MSQVRKIVETLERRICHSAAKKFDEVPSGDAGAQSSGGIAHSAALLHGPQKKTNPPDACAFG